MNNMREIVYSNLNLKSTEELVEIWKQKNKEEWTELALEIVEEILITRLGEIPDQIMLFQENSENDDQHIKLELSDTPEFYNPKDVIMVEKWLIRASNALILLITINSLFNYKSYYSMASAMLENNNVTGHYIAVFMIIILLAINAAIIFFPMRGIGFVLKILMQIEFNSRKR